MVGNDQEDVIFVVFKVEFEEWGIKIMGGVLVGMFYGGVCEVVFVVVSFFIFDIFFIII